MSEIRPTADPFAPAEAAPAAPPDPANLVCPAPIPERARVLLGHGSGGQLSAALMRAVTRRLPIIVRELVKACRRRLGLQATG